MLVLSCADGKTQLRIARMALDSHLKIRSGYSVWGEKSQWGLASL